MTDAGFEIEAKFEISNDDRLRLYGLEHAGDFSVISRRTIEQDDLYFDTADARLAAAGSTLRVRRTVNGAFMTFKGKRASGAPATEEHVATRLEDEVRLSTEFASEASSSSTLPDDSALSPLRRARDLIGDADLLPAARLENTRVMIDLADKDGHRLELSLDRCVATRLSDGRVVEFGEVELEAKGVEREVLLRVAAVLTTLAPTLRPSLQTKLERALR